MKPKNEELTKAQSTALARPSFIQEGDRRGTENITTKDIRPPALRLAQALTPETKRSESSYIDGLTEGLFFNSLSREIYGEGPIRFLVVNQLGHRHVEFAPMGEGGGVIDFNVPDGDPRTEFTTMVKDGKETRVKPKATKFYDYLILLLRPDGDGERGVLMTLSLKGKQLKKAVYLNTVLMGSKLPSFAHVFTAEAVPEKHGSYSFYGWKLEQAGWPSEAIYHEASSTYDAMKGKTVVLETESTADDDVEVVKDDIPF
jgi:hypothetical protein